MLERCEVCHSGKWEGEECPHCSGWIEKELELYELRHPIRRAMLIDYVDKWGRWRMKVVR